MGTRLQLQTLLENLLGTRNVYFQPPPNVMMAYPCIVYERSDIDTSFADDKPYSHMRSYQVTLMDRNPDSSIIDKLIELPRCTFDRHFTADSLNHDIFSIYY